MPIRLTTLALAILAIVSGQSTFVAAKIVLDQMTVFPISGPHAAIVLPRSSRSAQVVRTYGDGKSIYMTTSLTAPQGITKVEFHPIRESLLPGSEEFVRVSFLIVTTDGRLRLSGCRGDLMHGECGVFETDPTSRTARSLQTNVPHRQYQDISPDGRYVLVFDGDVVKRERLSLGVLDLSSGNVQRLKGAVGGSWSPDGRWLAVARNNHLELLDATTLLRNKSLGVTDAPGAWSPDSKSILFVKSELSCALTLYGESLSILDVERGTRKVIESSHCQWTGGPITWINPAAVQ